MSAYTAGLRELADYLDHHPTVPQPQYGDSIVVSVPSELDDAAGLSEVVRTAATFGTDVRFTCDGTHRAAHRSFGPIEYRIVSIAEADMADWRARHSYDDNLRAVSS